jgi:hypothetical protein
MQAVRRGRLNPSSFLSTEINLTTSSDESEDELFTSSKPLVPAKQSYLTHPLSW